MKAHQLLADEAAWTRRAMARDKDGHTTDVDALDACSRCVGGAVRYCYPGREGDRVLELIRVELGLDDVAGVFRWNDDKRRTHAEVIEVLRRLDV